MGRVRVVVLLAALTTAAAACSSSEPQQEAAPPAVSVETPATAEGLVQARTTFERARERADAGTLRALVSEQCLAGKQGRALETELDRLEPQDYEATIRIATRNVTRDRGEVRIRTHYEAPGGTERARTSGDWEPWVYEGRWKVDCTRPTVSPSAAP